jgi:hypothetical protein
MKSCSNWLFSALGLGENYGGIIDILSLTVKDEEIMSELMK